MQLSSALSWLVDAAGDEQAPDRFLANLGARLVEDSLPLAAGALTLDLPHPLIARRTFLWRAATGQVTEALGFVPGEGLALPGLAPTGQTASGPPGAAGRHWLAGQGAGVIHEDVIGQRPDGPLLAWIGPHAFTGEEADRLRQAARFAAAPLGALTMRATLNAALEAYLGRRSAARVLARPLRRGIGETIQAALLFADLRCFTQLSENHPPLTVIASLDAWFDRIAGSVHAFGGEVLKFIGDGVLAIFPVTEGAPGGACAAAWRAVAAARSGMVRLDEARRLQGLAPLRFGAALHLGEMLWGNIGAADRLDFTAIGPAVNLVSRLEGLCRPLDKTVLVSGAFAAETGMELLPLGTHALRGIAAPCAVFTVPEE